MKSLAELLTEIEEIVGKKIISTKPLTGGSIFELFLLESGSNDRYVTKVRGKNDILILKKEFIGLCEIALSKTILTPEIINESPDFLLMEYIPNEKPQKYFFSNFGYELAKMHRTQKNNFGFLTDNFIGLTKQVNFPEVKDWAYFYTKYRLEFQFKLAKKKGYADKLFLGLADKLIEESDAIFHSYFPSSSLLHGDLWYGNFLINSQQKPVLIDPAVYYGDRETDIAMTNLFGGFPKEFYSAYNEEYPLEPGFEFREKIYRLYHLLNHLNLFGLGYYNQSIEAMKFYVDYKYRSY